MTGHETGMCTTGTSFSSGSQNHMLSANKKKGVSGPSENEALSCRGLVSGLLCRPLVENASVYTGDPHDFGSLSSFFGSCSSFARGFHMWPIFANIPVYVRPLFPFAVAHTSGTR